MSQRRWERWSALDIERLLEMARSDWSIPAMAEALGRTEAAVRQRLHMLGQRLAGRGYLGWRAGQSCSACGRRDRPKAARGLCSSCYRQSYKPRGKLLDSETAALLAARGWWPLAAVVVAAGVPYAQLYGRVRRGKVPSARIGATRYVDAGAVAESYGLNRDELLGRLREMAEVS